MLLISDPLEKVLIITYYWPPSGGSGVQRWLKFVKYLPSFGWEPVVFTPENPSFDIRDESLLKDVSPALDVIHFPIWEPYQAFQWLTKLTGKKARPADFISTGKRSLFQKAATWIRGNVFIPDARVSWVRPSVTFLEDYLRRNGIRTIITTGPPHSVHLIGLRLRQRLDNLRWVADFRDPWSEWDLLDTLMLTRWARGRHRSLERQVLTQADAVTSIAPFHVRRLEALSGRRVELLTNGFDETDFQGITHTRTQRFTIRHMGVVDELRDPRPFMNAVRKAMQENAGLRNHLAIEFIGQVNAAFVAWVTADDELNAVTKFVGQLSHQQLLAWYGKTDVMVLVLAYTSIAPGNLPGKFFEYMASGNPIFCMGPRNGDAASIIDQHHLGIVHEREDEAGMKRSLLSLFADWKEGKLHSGQPSSGFSRRALTQKLVELLNKLQAS